MPPASPITQRQTVWVAGHEDEVRRPEGVAQALQDLGAHVSWFDLWAQPVGQTVHDGSESRTPSPRLLVVEALHRFDYLGPSLRAFRDVFVGSTNDPHDSPPTLAVVSPSAVTSLDPALGFDDFLVWPNTPTELYARVRQLEWRASAFASDDTVKLGPLIIDVACHTVMLHGNAQPIPLTGREFSLLVALVKRRGRVLSRTTLLDVAWGSDYDGGAKTVDVHVRRLRAKLGDALPLETVRGAGYLLR